MFRLTPTEALLAAPLLLIACADTSSAPPTEPSAKVAPTAVAGAGTRLVQIDDGCDPTTFNAALGPGTCTRSGGVGFDRFLALLGAHHSVGPWHFAPSTVQARVGQSLLAVNHGGEIHTFTEVEEFGGGNVPVLNDLSGNPVPAPECLALESADSLSPGESYSDEVEEPGTERYQCCIHPWMRAVVNARP